MEKNTVVIAVHREGYSIDQVVDRAMTVGELIYLLESRYDEDQPIVFSHDGGYTYGSLRECNISESEEESEE